MTTNGDAPTGAGERNRQLREFYQAAYAKGADVAFSNWSATEGDAVVASSIDWAGKRVLDVGCGVGRLSRLLRDAGADSVVVGTAITGVDKQVADYCKRIVN